MPAIVISNLVSNYFWALTLLIQAIGWFLQLGALSSLASQLQYGEPSGIYGVYWWCVFLELFVLVGIIVAIMSTSASNFTSSLFNYRFVFLAFIVLILSYLIPLANTASIGSSYNSTFSTFLAGSILSSIVWLLWILALGAEPKTVISELVYNFCAATNSTFSPTGLNSRTVPPNPNADVAIKMETQQPTSVVVDHTNTPEPTDSSLKQQVIPTDQSSTSRSDEPELRARALYNYSASPDDPTEVSFTKGELFTVLDNKGKWWHVQKDDKTAGIAPSNYLELL